MAQAFRVGFLSSTGRPPGLQDERDTVKRLWKAKTSGRPNGSYQQRSLRGSGSAAHEG